MAIAIKKDDGSIQNLKKASNRISKKLLFCYVILCVAGVRMVWKEYSSSSNYINIFTAVNKNVESKEGPVSNTTTTIAVTTTTIQNIEHGWI